MINNMEIVLVILVTILLVLFMLSKDKYKEFIQPVDRKRYIFKEILPVGLLILDVLRYKYRSKYDRRLLAKMTEIYGSIYSRYHLKIHWANKIIYCISALLLAAFIGMATIQDVGYGFFCISLLSGVIYLSDNELNKTIKERRTMIKMDFPDFLNKLTLLISAGMTISKAWEKVTMDSKKGGALYEELGKTLHEIRSGKSINAAYENFAKRCRIPEITRVISVILQNLKKGSSEIVSILRIYSNDCWEMRKNTAKKIGEEASTKMLLPMMLMFIAILLIVATPAVLVMRGI